jgi:hypothetical protein
MVSKVPAVLVSSGVGLTLLGTFLWWYQYRTEKRAREAALKERESRSASRIPVTVFADEGVPLEERRSA